MTAGLDELAGGGDTLALWNLIKAEMGEAVKYAGWADTAITLAQGRHPAQADLLWHGSILLAPRTIGTATMGIDWIYAGHARELLDRLAAGKDTRPATDAEICLICSEMSLRAPLTSGGTGVYFNAWMRAFPGHDVWDGMADEAAYHARMDNYEMAELERMTRRRGAIPGRALPKDQSCDGQHADVPVPGCRFIPGTLDGLPPAATLKRRKPRPVLEPGHPDLVRPVSPPPPRREHLTGRTSSTTPDPDTLF
jgi:hypothetical protein